MTMTLQEALATMDWSTFHPCGHPVQRFKEVPYWKPPCAQCSPPAPVIRVLGPTTQGLVGYAEESAPVLPNVVELTYRLMGFGIEHSSGERVLAAGFLWVPE
jgi:hypothetical protein